MKLNYHLTFDHYIEHQLFIASQSDSIRKKRRNTRFLVAVVYVILGLNFLRIEGSNIAAGAFIAFGIIWYFGYPFYSKHRYQRHYVKYIQEHYQNRIHLPVEMEIEKDFIRAVDKTGESRVNIGEVEALVSLPNTFLIKLKTGVSFVIPKDQVEEKEMLVEVFRNIGVEVLDEMEWQWK